MRLIFTIALLSITSFSFGQTSVPTEPDPFDSIFKSRFPQAYAEIDHTFPSFELKRPNKTINNKSIEGKVVLINFWFEGCAPCMAEMEALNDLFNNLKSNEDFLFISIARDNLEAINRVKKKYHLAFDAFPSNDKECKRLNFGSGYPTTIVLDKNGIIKNIHVGGPIEKEDASERVMTTLLSEVKALL